MGKKILDSKALYVILSIVIAVGLWFYVVTRDGNEDTQTYSGIPVVFEGKDILESNGLMILEDDITVSVRVRAPVNTIAKLRRDDITAKVDVSSVTSEGKITLGYTVTYPAALRSGLSQESQSPTNITFTVVKYVSDVPVEIRGVFNGTVADGYVPGDAEDDFKFSPGTLSVSGQASLVNQIAYAQVVVDGTDLTESIAGDYAYQFISNSGAVLENLDVSCSTDTVYTTFPIRATKSVPLKIETTAGGGITDANVTFDIKPESITVAGSRSDVDAIEEIILKNISLATVRDGDVLTMPIPLAEELENLSGQTEATVTVHISGVETRSIETTNISAIYVPEGWRSEKVTQAVTVEVRGTAEALAEISGENIRVVADLSEITDPSSGQYTITAKVYLDNVGGSAGIVGTEYRVVVSLTR